MKEMATSFAANPSESLNEMTKRAVEATSSAAEVMQRRGGELAVDLNKNLTSMSAMGGATFDPVSEGMPRPPPVNKKKMESEIMADSTDIDTLDFTYITPRVIAMGFPAEMGKLRTGPVKHNPINAVSKLLKEHHGGHYMIWNLSEESYEYSKFDEQVLEVRFPGHPAPPLGTLFNMCTAIENWLKADEKNVGIVHCLTGKGRTATVLGCFLAWSGEVNSPMDGLQFVSERRRSQVEKLTIPSQRRYVQYFTNMMDGVKPRSTPLLLRRVIVNTIPNFEVGLRGKGESSELKKKFRGWQVRGVNTD